MSEAAKRRLFLDGYPEGHRFTNVIQVQTKEQIEDLYASFYVRLDPPLVTLDCRVMKAAMFNNLLKFLEEYKGEIVMIAYDPVSAPVLSRFTDVQKYFRPRDGHLMEVRMKSLPESIKGKVGTLYGISVEEKE